MTQNLTEAEELLAIAKKKKQIVSVGMIERFNPAFSKLFSLTKKEKILGITIERLSPFPERINDANVIWDMMIHDLDLALLLAKTDIDSVKAVARKVKTKVFDYGEATLYFKDGTIAKVVGSRVSQEKRRMIQVSTDKAIYYADLLGKKLSRRLFTSLGEEEIIEVPPADQLNLEQRDFVSAVNKRKSSSSPIEEGIKVIKVAEEVEKGCYQ